MPAEGIVFFMIIPLLGSFFALLEKIWPNIKTAKPAVITVFPLCFLLLFAYLPAILQGRLYENFLGDWSGAIGIGQSLDGLAWFGLAVMYLVCAFSLGFAFAENCYDGDFYFFFLILLSGMAGVLLASDLFNLFVCLEIVGICAYILISYSRKERAIWASYKYLVLSSLGISLYLVGIFVVYKNTGTLFLGDLSGFFSPNDIRPMESVLAIACIVTGIGIRTAFIPFHTWLPEAHSFAPHPVSAILSGVVIKVTFLALVRLIILFNLAEVRIFLLWAGVLTALFGVVMALIQTECKLLLAWSTVSQMGFILAGFGAGTLLSTAGSLYHILNHALFKSLLFLSIGTVILFTGERSLKKISGMAGAMPFVAIVFLAGALSISGVPPFNGYMSKKLILSGLKDFPAAYWFLWVVSIGTFASFVKLSAVFRGETSPKGVSAVPGFPGKGFFLGNLSMLFLALLCLGTGVLGPFLLRNGIVPLFDRQVVSIPNLWATGSLFGSGLHAFLGIFCYLLIVSKKGKKIQQILSQLALPFDWALALVLCGFLFLFGVIYFS